MFHKHSKTSNLHKDATFNPVLALDSVCTGSSTPSTRWGVAAGHWGGQKRDEARPLVRASALCSLQWFDTDGWAGGSTKTLFH